MSLHLFIDYIDVLGLLGGVVDFFHPSTCFQGYGRNEIRLICSTSYKVQYLLFTFTYLIPIVDLISSYEIP